MNKFFKQFNSIQSLGYNCYSKMYLESIKIKQETNFFDYIGTSLWGIIDLLDDNFEGMFDKNNYKIMNIMIDEPDKYLVVNTKYFFRCKHEFKKTLSQNFDNPEILEKNIIDETELDDYFEKMKRRRDRFINMFSNDSNLLFLRYEEDPFGLISVHSDKIKNQYMDNLIILSGIFKKMNPKKKIIILNISYRNDKTEYIKDDNIIKIKMKKRIDNWINASKLIDDVIKDERTFLDQITI